VVRFGKHPDLIVHTEDPFNGGPPPARMIESYITPNNLFYVRNHGNVPDMDATTYRLRVDGLVRQPLFLSLEDLGQFETQTLVTTLQCAGNRRQELIDHQPVPGELPWCDDAIGNAEWTGVRLRDVLLAAGIQLEDGLHVAFTGLDTVERQGRQFGFGGSIPTPRALDADVLIATHMNGEPLPPVHGFPLRVVVPGYIGARSVKWLHEIRVQATPSDNYFQAHAYKLFPGWVTPDDVDYSQGQMLGESPLNAIIYAPQAGNVLASGPVVVRGIAIAGMRTVTRVDVSADGGQTWQTAELDDRPTAATKAAAWRFWQARFELAAGEYTLVARAWDSAANTQPSDVATVWNFKGYANNAWHRISVEVMQR
jgi:sulfite oxidase